VILGELAHGPTTGSFFIAILYSYHTREPLWLDKLIANSSMTYSTSYSLLSILIWLTFTMMILLVSMLLNLSNWLSSTFNTHSHSTKKLLWLDLLNWLSPPRHEVLLFWPSGRIRITFISHHLLPHLLMLMETPSVWNGRLSLLCVQVIKLYSKNTGILPLK